MARSGGDRGKEERSKSKGKCERGSRRFGREVKSESDSPLYSTVLKQGERQNTHSLQHDQLLLI